MKLNKKKQKKIRFSNLLFCLSFFLFIPYNLSSEEGFSCKTKKQSGLSNLGGEHKEILNYLGLTDFEVKFSRSREDIFRSESEQLRKVLTVWEKKVNLCFQLILMEILYIHQDLTNLVN